METREDITKAAILYLGLKAAKPLDSVKNLPVHCPFHVDKTPSLFIDVINGLFRCFSCQRGGGIETLFRELTGKSIYKALDITGDDFSHYTYKQNYRPHLNLDELDKEVNIRIDGDVMPVSSARRCISYLRQRYLSLQIADDMNMKYTESAYINKTLYKNRLLIPIKENGRLISLEGRDITGEQKAKVLYPKDSTVNTLYGIDNLNIDDRLYVVEGLMDLALLRKHKEFRNSTCIFGAALSKRQIHLLKRFNEIVIIPDNDKAGKLTLQAALKAQLPAYCLELPSVLNDCKIKDVGDLYKAKSSVDDLLKRKWLSKVKKITLTH